MHNCKKKDFNRVCMPATVYVLLFYLLISSEEEIKDTFFFTQYGIPDSICKNLKNSYYIDTNKWYFNHLKKLPAILYMLFLRETKWRFMKKAEIYGLDYNWFLLRGLKLNYIEDSPNIFSNWQSQAFMGYNNKHRQGISEILENIICGNFHNKKYATSDGIKSLHVSVRSTEDYIKNIPQYLYDLKKCWLESSDNKKNLILSIFNVTPDDFKNIQSRKVIILTQPLYVDSNISKEEQIKIYDNVLSNYDRNSVIIKSHPRDEIDYENYFPEVCVFNKPIPMQLFGYMGAKFDIAATLFSSAVGVFSNDSRIDWYSTMGNERLIKAFGIPKKEDYLK